MKKKIIIIISIVLLLFILIPKEENKDLRIRVIANSNNPYDQEIKYRVASEAIRILNKIKNDNIDLKERILSNIPDIKKQIEVTLKEKNYHDVSLDIYLGEEKFPTKTYNDKIIPGGVYETLVIKIGDAKGSNWWSLLYPEFFELSFEEINSNEVEYRSYIWDNIKKIFK